MVVNGDDMKLRSRPGWSFRPGSRNTICADLTVASA
jgi:hypothetical protein